MSRRRRRWRRWLLVGLAAQPSPSHAGSCCPQRPDEVTLDVQGEVVVGNQCVVAVFLQRLCRRRVFAPMPVLFRGGGVVVDERGT
jgi:hypothetical protein